MTRVRLSLNICFVLSFTFGDYVPYQTVKASNFECISFVCIGTLGADVLGDHFSVETYMELFMLRAGTKENEVISVPDAQHFTDLMTVNTR